MKWIFALSVVTAIVIAWVTVVRPWMRDKPWAQGFFALVEPIELHLWRKSETLLFARFLMILGPLLSLLTQLQEIDITPLMPLVPDAWELSVRALWNFLPMVSTVLGWVVEQLRKDTTRPLEAIAVSETKPLPPKVAEAEAKLEVAVAEMKQTFNEAKSKGEL